MSLLAQNSPILQHVAELGFQLRPSEPLSAHTSLGVGGRADLVRIHDYRRLPELVEFLKQHFIPWRILGGGTNLLVTDQNLGELVLQLVRGVPGEDGLKFQGSRVEVPASANLGTMVMQCAKRNLGGMEGLIGVPGTVGGALRMNAGAYGMQIGDVVNAVTVFRSATALIETLQTENVRFEYRHTGFAPQDILLSVRLELPERPYPEILERIKLFNHKRRASQPISEKSAGCIFKNPPGLSAGKMIDELGLKGTRLGGAVVSERHANFFVNRYQATAADFLNLIGMVRERVLRASGVELQEEVIVWKN